MVGKVHPHSRENRILNIRAVSAPPEHSTQRRMNMIAKNFKKYNQRVPIMPNMDAFNAYKGD